MRVKGITSGVKIELAALERKHRKLTEQMVVDASRDPESALHPLFLWDNDEEAARLGRLEIARTLIVSVHITAEEAEAFDLDVQVRKYHGLGDGYRSLDRVMNKEDLRQRLLMAALEDLEQIKRRYSALKDLLGDVFAAIDQASEGAKSKR